MIFPSGRYVCAPSYVPVKKKKAERVMRQGNINPILYKNKTEHNSI